MKNKIYEFLVPILKKLVNNEKVQNKVRFYSTKYLGNHLGKYFLTLVATVLAAQGLLLPNITTEHFKQFTEPVSNILTPTPEVINGLEIDEDEIVADKGTEIYKPSITLKDWGDVKGDIEYVRTRKQNKGTCVYESEDMLAIRSLQHLGFDPVENGDETFIDISYAYWNKVYKPKTDTGEVPFWAYKKFLEKGLPIKLNKQFSRENKLVGEFKNWENDLVAETRSAALLKAPFKLVRAGRGADDLFRALEKYQDKKKVVRLSIKNLRNAEGKRCNNYYFSEFPSTTIHQGCFPSGGHSTVMYDELGIFKWNGKPSIAIRVSTGSKDKRIVDIDFYRTINTTWEIYEPSLNGELVTIEKPMPTKSADYNILSTTKITYGDRSENVKALQRFLKVTADGKFGNGTRIALRNWQYKVFGKYYTGKYWGSGSIRKYKTL